jgi:hypothetical protein
MRLRSIPPVTSTGNNRSKTPAPFRGLAQVSIGRYVSDRAKRMKNADENSWDVSRFARSEFNRKSGGKLPAPVISDTIRKINDSITLVDDYNEKGDFAILLQLHGITLLGDTFTTCSTESTRQIYFIPVLYNNKAVESYLLLSTAGDIFEYEIVRDINNCCTGSCFIGNPGKKISKPGDKEFCSNRLFRNEVFIPKLLETFNWRTMEVVIKDGCMIVTYKKK